MPQQPQAYRLSNGALLDLSSFDISTPQGKQAAREAIAKREVELQLPSPPKGSIPEYTRGRYLPGDQENLLRAKPQADPYASGLRSAIADPKNRGDIGGLLGGLGGGLLAAPMGAAPVGAAVGSALGGTLGSWLGQRQVDPDKPVGRLATDALQEGGIQGAMELLGLGLPMMGRGMQTAGKHFVRKSFGPQSKLVSEFGGTPDELLDQLVATKLKTPTTMPLGSRRLIALAQEQHIDPALRARTNILEGPKGDITRPSTDVFKPQVTPTGETVTPWADVGAETRKPTANREGIQALGKHVKKFYDDPRVLRSEAKVSQRPNPDFQTFLLDLQGKGFSDDLQKKLAEQSGISPMVDKTIMTRSAIQDIPARVRQDMVTGNYKILDDLKAWGDPSMSAPVRTADREARKAITRALKEGIAADVPEVAPLNKTMSEWIPFREAAIQARYRGQISPEVRLGEAYALSHMAPQAAVASLFNRPSISSVGGQSLFKVGRGVERSATLPPILARLSMALAGGED